MLELIQKSVQESVELLLGDEETDPLQSHQLVIHDDEKKFNDATSHEVRNDFNIWVAVQLPQVVNTPETLQKLLKECENDPIPCPKYGFGARFNFALFVVIWTI
jgi:hypothetical protein